MSYALIFLIIGVILITLELLAFQFSIFWVMFFGLGALLTSVIAVIFPSLSLAALVAIFIVSSLVIGALIFRPLLRWQRKPSEIAGHDAIGQTVTVIETVSDVSGKVLWSGSRWNARLDPSYTTLIDAGDTAIISDAKGIHLHIKPSK